MDKLLKGEINSALAGFTQSVLVAAYCATVGAFMFYVEQSNLEPGYLGVFLMLTLFVFSAAVTGLLVLGLPAYLALNNKIGKAIAILGYTLLFSFLILLISAAVVFSTA